MHDLAPELEKVASLWISLRTRLTLWTSWPRGYLAANDSPILRGRAATGGSCGFTQSLSIQAALCNTF